MTEVKIYTENAESATIMIQVLQEIERAEAKHPIWPTDLIYMDAIINEEKGEVSRACVQYAMEGGSIEEVKKELIQTAATCIRMLKIIQKGGYDANGKCKPSELINQAITNLTDMPGQDAADLRVKLWECLKLASKIQIKNGLVDRRLKK